MLSLKRCALGSKPARAMERSRAVERLAAPAAAKAGSLASARLIASSNVNTRGLPRPPAGEAAARCRGGDCDESDADWQRASTPGIAIHARKAIAPGTSRTQICLTPRRARFGLFTECSIQKPTLIWPEPYIKRTISLVRLGSHRLP